VVQLPDDRGGRGMQSTGRQAVPSPWGEMLRLPALPRADLSKLPRGASGPTLFQPGGGAMVMKRVECAVRGRGFGRGMPENAPGVAPRA